MAAIKELARKIQGYIDSYGDSDNVSWSGSRFDSGSQRAGDALVPFIRWHFDRWIKVLKETQPAHRSSGGRVWWCDGGTGDGVVLEVKSNLRVQVRQDVGDLARGVCEDEMLV